MDEKLLRKIIEGALLAAGTPLSVKRIRALFEPVEGAELELEEQPEVPGSEEILAILQDIQGDYKNHGFELKELGSGWRFQVVEETAPWISKLWEEKPQKYSRALLETLSLIAYRQPITRGDIESIRGVAVSSHIIKTLTEREWVKVVGHRDVPGRPALYATTKQFLDYFNIKSLDELPSLQDIQDLDAIDSELNFNGETPNTEQPDANENAASNLDAQAESVSENDQDPEAKSQAANDQSGEPVETEVEEAIVEQGADFEAEDQDHGAEPASEAQDEERDEVTEASGDSEEEPEKSNVIQFEP
ncbi:SMC-Scp complex subunit ScpB [Aurantivibrio plasticivorans]